MKTVFRIVVLSFILYGVLSFTPRALAEESQILSVTPPLFQLSVAPGNYWQSSVKVVNGNPYELTVYAEVVNFAPEGEAGQGRFIPLIRDDDDTSTIGEWITLQSGPYVIPPEQTVQVPFSIEIPQNAPPGGHFAAILINTQPPQDDEGPMAVLTTQTVTSLIFARIEGDIVENGTIREFSVIDNFVEKPEAEFSLRFENKGNVHLQPRGDIIITNMWGTIRGQIPINQQTHYGNVLPKSIRDFHFTWAGESSLTDIGRYKAEATLVFGEDEIQNTTSIAYFWVIPVKATLITVGSLALFIYFVTWMIRLYVRRMLALAGVDVHTMEHVGTARTLEDEHDVRLASYKTVSAPLRSGAHDLRDRLSGVTEFIDVLRTLGSFVRTYKLFFISMCILIVGFIGIVLYISDVSEENRAYEVRIKEGDSERVIHSGEPGTEEHPEPATQQAE
jgi:hypothetical protein